MVILYYLNLMWACVLVLCLCYDDVYDDTLIGQFDVVMTFVPTLVINLMMYLTVFHDILSLEEDDYMLKFILKIC